MEAIGEGSAGGGSGAEDASELAHALRGPLGVITGYLELLRSRDDPGLREEGLRSMQEAARRLQDVVDRLVGAVTAGEAHVPGSVLGGARAAPGRPAPALDPPERRTGRRRVLVVDDDDEIRELLLRTVPLGELEMFEARDGREALDVLAAVQPDLVLLDWNLPSASGEEVLAALSRRERRVPVVVLTADDEPRRREAARALGADAFLAKPFSPLELLGEVERLLG